MHLEQFLKRIFPTDLELCFDRTENGSDTPFLTIRSIQSSACCPACEARSARIHNRYTRLVTDLPRAGLPVKLVLAVRRFRCGSIACSRQIFAERFPSFVEPYARLSVRLQNVLKHVALTVGGEPGKRLLWVLGISASGDKLFGLAYDAEISASVSHRIIGVDDFAFKRGETYGTVIVDLETRKPVELLPDRSARALATWLESRTGIKVISRDRSTEFERGISLGAPDAERTPISGPLGM